MCGPTPCSKPDCTWSEAHRAACEARLVMSWPSHERKAYYAMVKRKRGDVAAAALIVDVNREWKKTNATTSDGAEGVAAKNTAIQRMSPSGVSR